ncbi:pentatricopeptide repeat-containing protein [Scenedesmus sp. PABB004]|nr:pentatricopeptide repeat-containing protein [Scenedesmus sp. PABB004]
MSALSVMSGTWEGAGVAAQLFAGGLPPGKARRAGVAVLSCPPRSSLDASDVSSVEALPFMTFVGGAQSLAGGACSGAATPRARPEQRGSPHPPSPAAPRPGPAAVKAGGGAPAGAAPPRKGQGYRRLWQMVSRVQRGERLGDSSGAREDVTVEDLIRVVQQTPAGASAVDVVAPGLAYLDSRAVAALLKGLGKSGLGTRAVEIFDFLRALAHDHELSGLADVFTYTTMIAQCNSHHQLRRALELVAEMRSRAVPLANELDLGLDVYAQMLAEGCAPNLVTFNTLLDIHHKAGRWGDAVAILDQLRHQNLKPEARAYNAVINTCNAAGRYAEGAAVHEAMLAAGVEPNAATYGAALTSYARSGQLDAALSLFGIMAARGHERGASAYAAVLAACEPAGRWDVALELLQQMEREGVRPSTACLTAALTACLRGGQPARAEALFERMCAVATPDAATFNALVCVYARLGKAREAVHVLEALLRGGQCVDPPARDAAMDACWATGVVELQRYAVQLHDAAHAQGLHHAAVAERACPEGNLLEVQLPSGPPHVALIGLLHALRELRNHGAATLAAPAMAKVVLRLALQGQDAAAMHRVLAGQLAATGAPFTLLPAPGGADELRFGADAPAVAEWLRGGALAAALGVLALPGRGVDGMLAAQEDAQREIKCRQALLSVQAFEANAGVDPAAIPPALLVQRGELVQLLLRAAPCLGLPAEAGHDAAQLLDRVLASGLASCDGGRLLAGACLALLAPGGASSMGMLAAVFQASPQALLLAAGQVRALLGGRGAAISAMRVLRLLVERLGVEGDDAASTRHVAGQALAVACRAAASPAFVGVPPSVAAVAVLYASRAAAGLLPAWPAALASLTGFPEGSELLAPYVEAAMQLVLEAPA